MSFHEISFIGIWHTIIEVSCILPSFVACEWDVSNVGLRCWWCHVFWWILMTLKWQTVNSYHMLAMICQDYMHRKHVSMMCWWFVCSEDAVYHGGVSNGFIYMHAGRKIVPCFIMMSENGTWKSAHTDRLVSRARVQGSFSYLLLFWWVPHQSAITNYSVTP
jgi:hypothetical protein